LSNRHVTAASGPALPSAKSRTVTSPCVQVCIVDGPSGLCLGCFRSLSEIGSWSQMSENEREVIMNGLEARRGRIAPSKLAGNLP